MSSQIDFIQYKFDQQDNISFENHSKDALNYSELFEIWLAFLVFFRDGTLSRIPLRPVSISI